MGRRSRHMPPFETTITHLGPRGVGIGEAPDGAPVHVRGVPPGAEVGVRVFKRKKGTWHARRTHTVAPPPDGVAPRCAVFGLCGGCTLQELPLEAQRREKAALVLRELGELPDDVTVHAPTGADDAYAYRNKVEMSFGVARYLDQADLDRGVPIDGRFLGMHAPGRFDRVVDSERCELISEDANRLLATVRRVALDEAMPAPWNVRDHQGFWRHLLLRQGYGTGEHLAAIYTSSQGPAEAVEAVAEALLATPLEHGTLVGVVWFVNDGVADVARGDVGRTWGRDHLVERLGEGAYRLSPDAFFQTSTEGARVLYDTIGEAVGEGGTLVDLYCGAGSIGLYLASRFDGLVGIETVEAAVADARANAAAQGVEATFHAAKVEDALPTLAAIPGPRRLVVDPPRPGLHPKVTEAVARADADVLVYVACNPASLGRDRTVLEAGGWRPTDLWTVDLFPQTGHVEAVMRFVKEKPA